MAIWRRLTAFGKLAVFCVATGLRENFTVRGLKCRSYDKGY